MPNPNDVNAKILSPKGFPRLPNGWSTSVLSTGLYMVVHSYSGGPKRALFVVHGQGEHGGRYLHLPAFLGGTFGSIACADLQGHGQSPGQRGHIDSFDAYGDAVVVALRAYIESLPPGTEVYWLGHSMGGLITLDVAFKEKGLPVKAFFISSPLLALSLAVPKIKELMGRLMANIWGTLSLSNEINVSALSHDVAVQEAYSTDPLCHNRVTPRFFIELEKTMAKIRDSHSLSYPVLVFAGTADNVVSTPTTEKWFSELQAPRKKLFLLQSGRHETMNEGGAGAPTGVDKAKVFEQIANFVTG